MPILLTEPCDSVTAYDHVYAAEPNNDVGYAFGYSVAEPSTNTAFTAGERRSGTTTAGSYSVQLPDGRTQTVTYSVDGNRGYVADVSYSGEVNTPGEPYQGNRYT